MRNTNDPTRTMEMTGNNGTPINDDVNTTGTFFRQPVSVGGQNIVDGPFNSNDKKFDLVAYRGVDFRTKDLINMRGVIH